MRVLLLVAALLATAACRPTPCEDDSDCAVGHVCAGNLCVEPSGGGEVHVGHLTLAAASATVQVHAGDETPGTSFTLGNDGTAALHFHVGCEPATVSAMGGAIAVGASADVAVTLPSYSTPGQHTITCAITTDGTGGPLTFAIAVDVLNDVTPPALSFVPPTSLTGTATLTAAATDALGVTEVDYALDGALIGIASGEPFSITWVSTVALNGPHTLAVTALDAAGNASTVTTLAWVVNSTNGASVSVHTSLGLPDNATPDVTNPAHYLSVKPQYVISYDGAKHVPNWAAWELNASWFGTTPRQNDFRTDSTLPAQISQAQLADYAGSNYDRGHLCPSDDRTATVADNQSTFLLTNMVPQPHPVNAGPWLQLENVARVLANAGKEVLIVAGGVYASGAVQSIGPHLVAVPSAVFKLIVVLDAPGQAITSSTRVIAAIIPNDSTITQVTNWKQFRVAPHDIELATGLTLMPDVEQSVRDTLINAVDLQ